MLHHSKLRVFTEIVIIVSVLATVVVGVGLGWILASTRNLDISGNIGEQELALPSQILDRNGELITEFFAEEKRKIISINELPKHVIYAIIASEDQSFFRHNGFDLVQIARAFWNNVRGSYFSGASTITQQVAGELYTDRSEITYRRKIIELWYAFQMERSLTKYQILELYLNTVYYGHNTYGIEAASQFYFDHSARDLTLAESAILFVQIRSPATYSMIKHPNRARSRQRQLLNSMVALGYVTQEEADRSFAAFWDNYDMTRSASSTAYFDNEDRAPYFSEYVRRQLDEILFGSLVDIYKEGFVIHTTLDLEIQETAESRMAEGFQRFNTIYRADTKRRIEEADSVFIPMVEMLSLAFGIEDINVAGTRIEREANAEYYESINPVLDALSLVFDSQGLREVVYQATEYERSTRKKTTVEGALITLDNETGHIRAMVGGSDFKTKKFNRAVDATVQPGSAFKPLFYSAGISSRVITPATVIYDSPVVFFNADGTKYEPENFLGMWEGKVRARTALAHSMNVPSTKVLDWIGFDSAIERASRLLGMYDQRNDETLFPRKYPLALGVVSVAPINMARAFATFANQGRAVEPLAIRYIEDRQGNVLLDHEKDMIEQRQRKPESEVQILTPQEAYIMVSMLESTVQEGTLRWRRHDVGGFDGMAMAGKTGTTQNWSNAWTVGFSPYMTTAVWFGFDLQGESLGLRQTGATGAGPVWAWFMKDIHQYLPKKEFIKPDTGLITRQVCAVSGMLLSEDCDDGAVEEVFLTGTEPTQLCTIHPAEKKRNEYLADKARSRLLFADFVVPEVALPDVSIPELYAREDEEPEPFQQTGRRSGASGSSGNPLLD